MTTLHFLQDTYRNSPCQRLEHLRPDDAPAKPGVYILLATARVTFRYPRGRSPVFYIGQARDLCSRLLEHRRYYGQARHDRKLVLYWPIYEYAAAYGARYTYILAGPRQRPRALEGEILAMFATRYRSWPVANGAGAWDSVPQIRRAGG